MKMLLGMGLAVALCLSQVVNAAYVDPRLATFAKQTGQTKATVIVLLKNDSAGFVTPRRYNYTAVRKFLMERSKAAWGQMQNSVAKMKGDVDLKKIYWINNSVVAVVTSAGLKKLAQIPMVEKIYANGRISYMKPVKVSDVRGFVRESAYPYDLVDLGVDKLFETRPDIQGKGVDVGLIDTGADGPHPALNGKIALFYDAENNKVGGPAFDRETHGTHTAGTIVGGDRQSNLMGVAPEAKLFASAALSNYDAMLKAMEFMLDPDKDPNTKDQPRLVSNSWNTEGAPDQEIFYRAITAWESAGILPVFSAGNSGPASRSITKPHEHPGVIAVAATDKNGKVASFSSRGPAVFQGKTIEKPDMSAPGVDIVSTVPGGKTQAMSGTSMACPHAAGVAALIYQVNPNFTPVQVREIMVKTLTFVKEDGTASDTQVWNASYGLGRLNAYAAVEAAFKLGKLHQDRLMQMFQPTQTFLGSQIDADLDMDVSYDTSDLLETFITDESRWIDSREL